MAYRGDHPAPLLPASLRDRLQGWLWKLLGLSVLVACVALSVSLLSWSVADPSLTHATSAKARNLLGPLGAILSGLIMQMLGLAGVFALLPPMFWGLQLLTAKEPPGLRGKLLLAPLAVLFLAGAASALPRAEAWPMEQGYGGLLGDLGLSLLASVLGHVNPGRSFAAAGLFYLAAGLVVLMSSLGLTRRDLRLICQTNARPGLEVMAGWWRELHDQIRPLQQPTPVGPDPRLTRDPPTIYPEQPAAERPVVDQPISVGARAFAPADDAGDHEPEASEVPDSGRGPDFDRSTDRHTRTIAERFAPAAGDARDAPAERPQGSEHPRAAEPRLDAPSPRRGTTAPCPRPPLTMLKRPAAAGSARTTQAELRNQAKLLAAVLDDFGIKGEIKAVHPGPVITLFELEPARGVKSARVISLADDIARSMGAVCARVAVVPGRNAIGIELPTPRRETVALRELFESAAFRDTDASLPLALGKDITGAPVLADLARMPHLLLAGTTGAGKSVGVNAMILSLLYRLSPDQCRFLMIDPKMLELSVYNGIPHLLCPVVTEPEKAVAALNWVVREMEERYRRMALLAVRNIDVFNNRVRHAQKRTEPSPRAGQEADLAPMPYIVVVVDEFADLMLVAGKEIESAVQRLAQMARAAGIHLIMATQRPSVDVITGTIKANFPTRISYKVASKFDSRTILNEQGAEQLLGQGDMLFSSGIGRPLRVHGPFVSDQEVENVAAFLRDECEPRYIDGITDTAPEDETADAPGPAGHDLYGRAVAIVVRDRKASTSYLQRRLLVGYNRAAALMERMEQDGVVSAADYKGRRQVLVDTPGAAGEDL